MRFLFVFDIGFDRGGPSVHLLQDILRSALEEGHAVKVILKKTNGPDKEMPDEFLANPNFHYHIIDEKTNKKSGFISRYIDEIKYAKKCAGLFLSDGRFDAVFLQSNVITYFYMKQLKKLDCRIVYNVQDIFPYNLKLSGQLPLAKITFPIFRKLQNAGYKMADKIITISDDMKQTLVDDGVESDKIEVVYNWSYADTPIRLETIDPENVFDLHLDHNKFNVVYAGNIGKMQNVELIAKAAREMEEDESIHFYIIGDGANKRDVEQIANGLKNVTMLPMQPVRYAESIYAQADLNVIPLMLGGIRTALPSKTATVLRVNKPMAFCIDGETEIEKLMGKIDGVYFCDCCDTTSVKSLLQKLMRVNSGDINRNKLAFLSVANCNQYIKCMVG